MMRFIALLTNRLSWQRAKRLGSFLGLVWFYLVRIRRRVVFANLAQALPHSASRHSHIARRAYAHFGESALEFLKLHQMDKEEVRSYVHLHGMENYEKAAHKGRGVIVVTAHFGNFDLLACSQADMGIPLAIVSRDLHSKGIGRFWMETRQSWGLKIFPDKGAARGILRWLRQGNVLGLTVDQRTAARKGGVELNFMGSPAWTTTVPAKLALRTGAALLPVRIERRIDGDHDIFVEPELELEGAETVALTGQINEIIGNWVRSRPEQWLWLHRRFRREC